MAHGSTPTNILALLDLLPPDIEGKRFLDVGFGCGQVSHMIVTFVGSEWCKYKGTPYIIGLDIDSDMVALAKKWMPFYREVYQWDATKIPYPPEMVRDIDVVICTEVPEHLTDKVAGLKMVEYLRDIAPLVIFTCPNGDNRNHYERKKWMNHNTVWWEKDFRDLGFQTKLVSQYPKEVAPLLNIASWIAKGHGTYKTIVAWYQR